ncbi:Fumarate hydratase class I OS=Streptomyces fumanus OX=67302 GN=GCM10018772_41270 PE=3 SV=1 [Streptomyces fumanus]
MGGTSAEYALKTAKYASAHYLDEIPAEGSPLGHGFRDKELEEKVFELTQKIGIGAQFGGKYFCHDVRVVRLPRHGASCPVAIAVSCSADRQAVAKITAEGVFLERLETDPARFLPDTTDEHLESDGDVVRIDLNQPMDAILAELTKYPVKTRLSLTGPGRGARHCAREDQGAAGRGRGDAAVPEGPPGVLRGPGEDAGGLRVGFLRADHRRADGLLRRAVPGGGRLQGDARQGQPQQAGHRRVCRARRLLPRLHRRAGRAAGAGLHQEGRGVEYEELGMEAVWKIEVEDFPAFVVVDDKGNDFFQDPAPQPTFTTIPVRGPGLA